MPYRHGERNQSTLLPKSIEDYITPNDPVRIYDAFIEALDLDKIGIPENPNKAGNPEYHPRAMLKLLVYGYAYGFLSSRKLERATHHNLSFIWLMGGLKPDHKTIAYFKKNNAQAIEKTLILYAQLCSELKYIAHDPLFDTTKPQAKPKHHLTLITDHIASLLAECDDVESQESSKPSLIKVTSDLPQTQELIDRIKTIISYVEYATIETKNLSKQKIKQKPKPQKKTTITPQNKTTEKGLLQRTIKLLKKIVTPRPKKKI